MVDFLKDNLKLTVKAAVCAKYTVYNQNPVESVAYKHPDTGLLASAPPDWNVATIPTDFVCWKKNVDPWGNHITWQGPASIMSWRDRRYQYEPWTDFVAGGINPSISFYYKGDLYVIQSPPMDYIVDIAYWEGFLIITMMDDRNPWLSVLSLNIITLDESVLFSIYGSTVDVRVNVEQSGQNLTSPLIPTCPIAGATGPTALDDIFSHARFDPVNGVFSGLFRVKGAFQDGATTGNLWFNDVCDVTIKLLKIDDLTIELSNTITSEQTEQAYTSLLNNPAAVVFNHFNSRGLVFYEQFTRAGNNSAVQTTNLFWSLQLLIPTDWAGFTSETEKYISLTKTIAVFEATFPWGPRLLTGGRSSTLYLDSSVAPTFQAPDYILNVRNVTLDSSGGIESEVSSQWVYPVNIFNGTFQSSQGTNTYTADFLPYELPLMYSFNNGARSLIVGKAQTANSTATYSEDFDLIMQMSITSMVSSEEDFNDYVSAVALWATGRQSSIQSNGSTSKLLAALYADGVELGLLEGSCINQAITDSRYLAEYFHETTGGLNVIANKVVEDYTLADFDNSVGFNFGIGITSSMTTSFIDEDNLSCSWGYVFDSDFIQPLLEDVAGVDSRGNPITIKQSRKVTAYNRFVGVGGYDTGVTALDIHYKETASQLIQHVTHSDYIGFEIVPFEYGNTVGAWSDTTEKNYDSNFGGNFNFNVLMSYRVKLSNTDYLWSHGCFGFSSSEPGWDTFIANTPDTITYRGDSVGTATETVSTLNTDNPGTPLTVINDGYSAPTITQICIALGHTP